MVNHCQLTNIVFILMKQLRRLSLLMFIRLILIAMLIVILIVLLIVVMIDYQSYYSHMQKNGYDCFFIYNHIRSLFVFLCTLSYIHYICILYSFIFQSDVSKASIFLHLSYSYSKTISLIFFTLIHSCISFFIYLPQFACIFKCSN